MALGPPHALQFVNVASDVGLDFRQGAFRWGVSGDPAAMEGGGLCWLDYDDDGWLDLYVVNSYAEQEVAQWKAAGGLPRSALFHNEQGKFEDVSAGSGADVEIRGNGCVAADLDLDGDTDLYVTTARSQVLLWNEGDGKFREGARAAGVDAYGWRTGAAVGDVNGDGWPDIFVAGYADMNSDNPAGTAGFPSTKLGVRDVLFLSNGRHDGRVTFREVGRQVGLEVSKFEYGLGALFTDLEGDGDLDLYLANDTNPDRLYENVEWPGGAKADPEGLGFRFEERAGPAGVADPGAGMGVSAGDYDGDGRSDLIVTNGRGQVHGVFKSNPPDENDPSYTDVRTELGPDFAGSVGWGVTWADLDLDTDLDLFVANGDIPVTDLAADAEPLEDYVNDGSKFVDASAASGLDAVGDLLARGAAAADYDNDGDVDFAVSQIGGPLVLLQNRVSGKHWLEVALDGFHPGALVSVVLPDGRKLQREARAGGSYLSSEDPRCLFGLGDATEVKELVVRWPDGDGDAAARRGGEPGRRGEAVRALACAAVVLVALTAAGCSLFGELILGGLVPRARLQAGGPARPLGRTGVGRGAPRRDPAGHARAHRPRPQPLPHVRRDVGRLGRLRRRRGGVLRQGEAPGRRCRGGARGSDELRRISAPPAPLLGRRRPPGDLRRADPDDAVALLRHRLRLDGGRFPGGSREPHRGEDHRLRAHRRRPRAHPLRAGRVRTGEPPARRGGARDDDDRPEPLAAARARAERRPERAHGPGEGAIVHRSVLGPREELRPPGFSGRCADRPGAAAGARQSRERPASSRTRRWTSSGTAATSIRRTARPST